MTAQIILALAVLVLQSSCDRPQLAVRPSSDQDKALYLYERFLERPSKEHLLDLLVACSEKEPDEEALVTMRNHLRTPDRAVGTIDGVDYTDHSVAVACLSALMGSVLRVDSLTVTAIISRSVKDTPYRYHLYAIGPDDASRLDQIASAWIDGFLAGRQLYHQ